jgi:hypothetical protein
VFQGMLLFYLLAADLFINFRLRWKKRPQSAAPVVPIVSKEAA